jgi:hypothetical protein
MAMGALLPRTAIRKTQDSGLRRCLQGGAKHPLLALDNGGILATSSVIASG